MITESEVVEAIQDWLSTETREITAAQKHAVRISSTINIGKFLVAKGCRSKESFLESFREAVGTDSPEYAKIGFALGMADLDLLDRAKWDGKLLNLSDQLSILREAHKAAYGEVEAEEAPECQEEIKLARIEGEIEAWKEATKQLDARNDVAREDLWGRIAIFIFLAILAAALLKYLLK